MSEPQKLLFVFETGNDAKDFTDAQKTIVSEESKHPQVTQSVGGITTRVSALLLHVTPAGYAITLNPNYERLSK